MIHPREYLHRIIHRLFRAYIPALNGEVLRANQIKLFWLDTCKLNHLCPLFRGFGDDGSEFCGGST